MRIIGCPLKIFSNNRVYIPMEYLQYYGISEKLDRLLISVSERSLFYRPLQKAKSENSTKDTILIRGGLTYLPAVWIRQNGLKPGDTVFMLGIADGFLVSVERDLSEALSMASNKTEQTHL